MTVNQAGIKTLKNHTQIKKYDLYLFFKNVSKLCQITTKITIIQILLVQKILSKKKMHQGKNLNIIQEKMNDESLMLFGKYRGEKLANVPGEYLLYAYYNFTLSKDLNAYIEDNMDCLKMEVK